MIKYLLLDCDGIIVARDKYFSQRLLGLGLNLDENEIGKFFSTDFVLCKIGKKDLKNELRKQLPLWNLNWTVGKTIDFWFSAEREFDRNIFNYIIEIRQRGIKVFVPTEQEKYRAADLWENAGLKNITDGIFFFVRYWIFKN